MSGGMDNQLWLWPAGGVRGVKLDGHSSPVSQVCDTTPCWACAWVCHNLGCTVHTHIAGSQQSPWPSRFLRLPPSPQHTHATHTLAHMRTQVVYDAASGLVASCSYDKTVRLWDVGGRPGEVGRFDGHGAPVLEMDVNEGGQIISGE